MIVVKSTTMMITGKACEAMRKRRICDCFGKLGLRSPLNLSSENGHDNIIVSIYYCWYLPPDVPFDRFKDYLKSLFACRWSQRHMNGLRIK